MAGLGAQSRARERIEAIDGPLDAVAVRARVLDVLRGSIDFDSYVWLLTDPVSTVGAAPLAEVPPAVLPDLPALIRAKYATVVNRWTTLVHAPTPVGLLSRTTDSGSAPDRTWRELLTGHGVGDVASTVFADQLGCWGFLDLWRGVHRDPFDDADVDLLAGVTPAVTIALRECQARTFVEAATPHRRDVGPVVLTLDDELRIIGRTAASQEWLDVLLPSGPGEATVPASVYNVAAQLLAREAGFDDHPAWSRTHLVDGFWLTLRAARIASPGTERTEGIVVTVEETSAAERLDLFARAFALSARETELFGLLANGADTRAMSRAMHLSEHTVQDHLKSVFAKTGAHDRVTLLSRALGIRPPNP